MQSEWKPVNDHYYRNGNLTITVSKNVPKPYCLFKDVNPPILYGCFETLDEAMKRYEEVLTDNAQAQARPEAPKAL
jgi:hypothetical protein